jgi:predicted permease
LLISHKNNRDQSRGYFAVLEDVFTQPPLAAFFVLCAELNRF